ncbi:MAG: hypothetical protein ACI4AI_04750 [Paludibacteraceae bacterium]
MKLKHFAFVALVALFAACTNQESLLKDYEKACEKGDAVKAAKIIEKMEKKYPNEADWTLEQQIRMEKASVVLSKKALEDVGL